MNWTNYHGHCNFCDGHGDPEDYVNLALQFHMSAIGFSSHAPVPFESFWNMPLDKLQDYLNEIHRLKTLYQEHIEIWCGLEIDYVDKVVSPSDNAFALANLDYTIGSVHYLNRFEDGTYWAIDGSFSSFRKGLELLYQGDIRKAVADYFEAQHLMLTNSNPDIIGHIDKIRMHNQTEFLFDENESWYQDSMYRLLEHISQKGCIVEINTKSFQKNGILFPDLKYLKRISELKIPLVINSDAHYPGDLISGFDFVVNRLRKEGIRDVAVLKQGEWRLTSIH